MHACICEYIANVYVYIYIWQVYMFIFGIKAIYTYISLNIYIPINICHKSKLKSYVNPTH